MDVNSLLLEVLALHIDSPKWNQAIFERVKRVSNTKVGSVGQDFIERIAKLNAIDVGFPLNSLGKKASQSPWDIQLNGIKFELKTATEDTVGSFQFNHIRYHRPYDALLCLGIAPGAIYFEMWTKAEVTTGRAGNLVSMEKGANASYKLTKKSQTLLAIDNFKCRFSVFENEWNAVKQE